MSAQQNPEAGALHPNWPRLFPFFIALLAGLVYSNSFSVPFIFDDETAILYNRAVDRADIVGLISARYVVRLSFALNRWFGALTTSRPHVVADYHVVNLLIHVAAALALYAVVWRTLLLPGIAERYRRRAAWLALAAAGIWTVHPLQTQSVTYIVQRGESMMGLFYLLTLYGVIRGAGAERSRGWYLSAVLFCAVGMGCKEVMVTAPVVVCLYDRVFLSSSWRDLYGNRRWLYAGLAGTWGILALLMAATAGAYGKSVGTGFSGASSPLSYLATQFGVLTHYLRLAVWPRSLCLDYFWPEARTWAAILPFGAFIGVLALLTLWGLWRRPAWGFLGAWFFIVLAPTSSIVPVADRAMEHRMYLPLVSVVLLGVFLLHEAVSRLFARRPRAGEAVETWLVCALLALLGNATLARNQDYRSSEAIWRDTVAKRPGNPRAWQNLGSYVANDGRWEEAVPYFEKALELKPDYIVPRNNMGVAMIQAGRVEEGLAHCRLAARCAPAKSRTLALAHFNIAYASAQLGRRDEARRHYSRAVAVDPLYAEAHYNLATLLDEHGETDEALQHYSEAIRSRPRYAGAYNDIGIIMLRQGKVAEGIRHLVKAVTLSPDYKEAHYNLGNAMLRRGKIEEAISCFSEALRIDPQFEAALNSMGAALLQKGDTEGAIRHFSQVLQLDPNHEKAKANLRKAMDRLRDGRDTPRN
ncbi:MAG: tetratricopeptide repeat protein [Kiritimatiellae bacterium]|nr:tetratricopeptide repeat protein [Kiritimatiellia bacterium]